MPYDDHVQQKLEKDLYETFEYDPDATATISKRTIRAIDVVDFTMYFAFPSQGPRKQSGAESISEYLLKKHKPLNLAKTAKVIIDEFIVPMRNKGGSRSGTVKELEDMVHRANDFRGKLMVVDNGCCIVTNVPDRENTNILYHNQCHYRLEGAHIFPSALRDQKEITPEMIRRFCANREDCYLFGTHVDNTHNGILLQHDAHGDFDEYLWSLARVGTDPAVHKYKVEIMVETAHGLSFEFTAGKEIDLKRSLINDTPAPQLIQLHLQFSRLLMNLKANYI